MFEDAGGSAGSLEGGGDQPGLAPRVSGRVYVGVRWCGQDAGRDVRDGGVIVVDEPNRAITRSVGQQAQAPGRGLPEMAEPDQFPGVRETVQERPGRSGRVGGEGVPQRVGQVPE